MAQFGLNLALREVLTGQVKLGESHLQDIIFDTGGARPLMPLRLAKLLFKSLLQPVKEDIELVQPDGSLIDCITHQVTIPISRFFNNEGASMKVAPQNVTFLCGQSVPYMALGMQDIRKLGLLPNLAFFDIYYGTLGEIPVSIFRQQPLFSNVPSWLTDVKYRVLEKLIYQRRFLAWKWTWRVVNLALLHIQLPRYATGLMAW